jgi:hypothetical protein
VNWKRLKRTKSAEVRSHRFGVGFIRLAVGRFACPIAVCKEIARKNSRETVEKQETGNYAKLHILDADNETETRGKTEKEQRKNRDGRRIFSPIISRRMRQIRHLKKQK